MKVLLAITTYNRLDYLKKTLESWDRTKNPKYKWTVIVADDGSTDGTLEYLEDFKKHHNTHIIKNSNRGVHYQLNSIFKLCEDLKYKYAFRCEDDVIFKKSGWDDKYIEAIKKSKYDHLVYSSVERCKKRKTLLDNIKTHPKGLSCVCRKDDIPGAFWTFTPKVLKKVGYIDMKHFGTCGIGHQDYSYRCARAGFNDTKYIYDIENSNDYIDIEIQGYVRAPNPHREKWNCASLLERKKRDASTRDIIYVPYNTLCVDIGFNKVE